MSRTLKPNSTQIPDVILDEWLPVLSGAEFQVVMFVARKTFGWGKDRDRISLSQIEAGTSLARSTISAACEGLRARGMLCIIPGNRNTANTYWLNEEWTPETVAHPAKNTTPATEPQVLKLDIDQPSTKIELVRKSNYGSTKIVLQPSTKIEHTRNKERDTIQETNTPLPPDGGEAVKSPHVVNGSSLFIDCYRERFDGDDPLLTGQQHKKLAETFRGYKSSADLMRQVITNFMADTGDWAAGHDAAKFLLSPDRWRHAAPKARAVPAAKSGAASSAEYYTAQIGRAHV